MAISLKLLFVFVYSYVIIELSAENTFPIIGIVAQEFGTEDQYPAYSSHIAASYVKAVESSGARVVPIVPNKSELYYRTLLTSINGVLLPGENVSWVRSFPRIDMIKLIYKIVKEMNDAGITFPILGICSGFEELASVANEYKNFFVECNVDHQNLPLHFTTLYTNTSLFLRLSDQQHEILSSDNVTVNSHSRCALESDFSNSSLIDWAITSTSKSLDGFEFIASIEHKTHPFFGVQFHPEKVAFEWTPSHEYPHSEEAVLANRYFFDMLVFFARRNDNSFKTSREENRWFIHNYATIIPEVDNYREIYVF